MHLAEQAARLEHYEGLERELDEAVMHAASEGAGTGDVAASSTRSRPRWALGSSVPASLRRRLAQNAALSEGDATNSNARRKSRTRRRRRPRRGRKIELQLRRANSKAHDASQPYNYLVERIAATEADADAAAAREREAAGKLQDAKAAAHAARAEANALREDLKRALDERGELATIKNMLKTAPRAGPTWVRGRRFARERREERRESSGRIDAERVNRTPRLYNRRAMVVYTNRTRLPPVALDSLPSALDSFPSYALLHSLQSRGGFSLARVAPTRGIRNPPTPPSRLDVGVLVDVTHGEFLPGGYVPLGDEDALPVDVLVVLHGRDVRIAVAVHARLQREKSRTLETAPTTPRRGRRAAARSPRTPTPSPPSHPPARQSPGNNPPPATPPQSRDYSVRTSRRRARRRRARRVPETSPSSRSGRRSRAVATIPPRCRASSRGTRALVLPRRPPRTRRSFHHGFMRVRERFPSGDERVEDGVSHLVGLERLALLVGLGRLAPVRPRVCSASWATVRRTFAARMKMSFVSRACSRKARRRPGRARNRRGPGQSVARAWPTRRRRAPRCSTPRGRTRRGRARRRAWESGWRGGDARRPRGGARGSRGRPRRRWRRRRGDVARSGARRRRRSGSTRRTPARPRGCSPAAWPPEGLHQHALALGEVARRHQTLAVRHATHRHRRTKGGGCERASVIRALGILGGRRQERRELRLPNTVGRGRGRHDER